MDEVTDSRTSVHSQFLSSHRAMWLLNISRALQSPGTLKFRYNGHLTAKLSVDLTSKVCATIGGHYVRYFSVAEKKLV